MPDSIPPLLKDFAGVSTENLSADERLKMAIVGDFKTGKSWLEATAPPPVYIFDFDDRAESLAGKPGLYIERKATMQNVEAALSIAKYHKEQKLPNPATWGFDTVTNMQKAMEIEIFRLSSGLHRDLKIGTNLSVKIRNGWDAVNAIQRYLELLISEFSALGNVIFVFHERNEKDQIRSSPQETKFTGEITTDPQYLAKSLSFFNEVFRTSISYDNKFVVQCKPTSSFAASTSMLLDEIEEPNIQRMLEKHRQRLAEKAKPKP